jgi:hypothetical protein
MILHNNLIEQFGNAPGELLAVLLEPLPGHSDHEVVEVLTTQGAHEVEILSPGFISASIDLSTLRAAEAVAYIHPKRRQQLHHVPGAPHRHPATRR